MFFKKLYVRIWLSVVLAVAALTFWSSGPGAWPPNRVGILAMALNLWSACKTARPCICTCRVRRRRPGTGRPLTFFWPLVLVAVAVALATYPIIRKLKQRLEPLQNGVHK